MCEVWSIFQQETTHLDRNELFDWPIMYVCIYVFVVFVSFGLLKLMCYLVLFKNVDVMVKMSQHSLLSLQWNGIFIQSWWFVRFYNEKNVFFSKVILF